MKQLLHRSLLSVEKIIDRFRRPRRAEDPVIENYYGYANGREVVLRGRVLERTEAWESLKSDSAWRNFRGMASYWFTREIPHLKVFGEIEGVPFETTSDDEGYYQVTLPTNLPQDRPWITQETWLEGSGERFIGLTHLPGERAKRLIISDIDDTVIETGAQQLWQMIKTTLLKNQHTRSVFPGVEDFYKALIGPAENPLFYVTSSPWNLRAFLHAVLELREIPKGPTFMTDWGLDETKLLKDGHGTHKLGAIVQLLDFYPDLPAILIGDSGEKDPEIYSEIVSRFGKRIEAIYIRDVSSDERDREVAALAAACAESGVPLLLERDSKVAAADARERGFIE